MASPAQVSRRDFLRTSAEGAGALLLGFYLPVHAQTQAMPPTSRPARDFRPNAWLRISAGDQITVLVEKPEPGQGSRTYTPMMIAEELEVDWSAIGVEQAPTIPALYQLPAESGSWGRCWLAPAVANAVFDATGVRVRRLPIDSQILKRIPSQT